VQDDNSLDLDLRSDSEERKWLVLYEEDYSNVIIDGKDNVALLVDIEQASEVVRLATMAIESISSVAENDQEVLETLIEQLEMELDDAE